MYVLVFFFVGIVEVYGVIFWYGMVVEVVLIDKVGRLVIGLCLVGGEIIVVDWIIFNGDVVVFEMFLGNFVVKVYFKIL